MINFSCTNPRYLIVSFVFLINIALATPAQASNVRIFGLSGQNFITNPEDNVCYLDEHAKILMHINNEIHANGISDEKEMVERYQADFKTISDSLTCKAQATLLGVEKLPAIVFDGAYVVYGERNVQRARLAYQHFKGASQ